MEKSIDSAPLPDGNRIRGCVDPDAAGGDDMAVGDQILQSGEAVERLERAQMSNRSPSHADHDVLTCPGPTDEGGDIGSQFANSDVGTRPRGAVGFGG